MRVGVQETPQYIGRCTVRLDGEDVSDRCVWADDEAGEALLYELDDDGQVRVDRDQRCSVRRVHRGNVEIEIHAESTP